MWRWLGIGLLWLLAPLAQAQLLPALAHMPWQWSEVESWLWQGQRIQSQQFRAQATADQVVHILQEQLQESFYLQRTKAAWLISFQKQQAHYMVMLTQQEEQTEGWVSVWNWELTSPLVTPFMLQGLVTQIWQMQWEQSWPQYVMAKPKSAYSWSHFVKRLYQTVSLGRVRCATDRWCEWQQDLYQYVIWNEGEFWHLVWWPLTKKE